MVRLNEYHMSEEHLEELIGEIRKELSKGKKPLKDNLALNKIVNIFGGDNFCYTNEGTMIGLALLDVASRLGLIKRNTGEDVLQHAIWVALGGKDITEILVGFYHDVPENLGKYKEYKDLYLREPSLELVSDFQNFKKKQIDEIGNYINTLEKNLNTGARIGNFKRSLDTITRNISDPYNTSLNKIFAIDPFTIEIIKYKIIDAIVTGKIKTKDTTHNNKKVPISIYPPTERRKVGTKGQMTINAARIFLLNYASLLEQHDCNYVIEDYNKKLNEIIIKNTLDDQEYLKEKYPILITSGFISKANKLHKGYNDFEVRQLATPDELDQDPSMIFSGYLIRQMHLVNKQGWDDEDKRRFKEQNRWIMEHFAINEEDIKPARYYLDTHSSLSISNYFKKDNSNVIKGLTEFGIQRKIGIQDYFYVEKGNKKCQKTK